MRFALMLSLSFGLVGFATAEEPKDEAKEPLGAFTRSVGDFELTFTFKKDKKLQFLMKNTGSGDGMKFDADYTLSKDGKLEMTVQKAEKIGEFPVHPPKGTKYGFKIAMKGKNLVLSDLTGEDTEGAKDIVEGDYEPAKDK